MSAPPRRTGSAGAPLPPTGRPVQDTLHFCGKVAPATLELWPPAAGAGFDEAAQAFGVLTQRPRFSGNPLHWQIAELAANGDLALWWRYLVDGRLRARSAAAARALHRVEHDARWWREERASALAARHADLAVRDPRTLDQRALATLIGALAAQYAATVRLSQRLLLGSALALGHWLRLGRRTLGAEVAILAEAMPPPPRPGSVQLARLVEHADNPHRAGLEMDALRLVAGADLGAPTLAEAPALVYALARHDPVPHDSVWREHGRELADSVPPRHYRAFVDAWERAVAAEATRHEVLAAGPATAGGLLRRALLHAGERLTGRGLAAPTDVLSASPESVVAALLDGPLPVPLGAPPPPSFTQRADTSAYAHVPPTPGERMRELRAAMTGWCGGTAERTGPILPDAGARGSGISGHHGPVRGPLHAAADPVALWTAPAGAVVLITALSPSLPMLPGRIAAVVARCGGELSALATAVRAAHMPAVVGVGTVLDGWSDGELVVVDGEAGEVRRGPTR